MFDSEIFFNVNESLLHTLLYSELQDLSVAFFSLARDILACWFESELPWSFESRLRLEAVVRSSIVAFDYLKMGDFVVFLE